MSKPTQVSASKPGSSNSSAAPGPNLSASNAKQNQGLGHRVWESAKSTAWSVWHPFQAVGKGVTIGAVDAADVQGLLTNALLDEPFPILIRLTYLLQNSRHPTRDDLKDLKAIVAELISNKELVDAMFKGPEKRVQQTAEMRQNFIALLTSLRDELNEIELQPEGKRSVPGLNDAPQKLTLSRVSYQLIDRLSPYIDIIIKHNQGALLNAKDYLQAELPSVISSLTSTLDRELNTEPSPALLKAKLDLQTALALFKGEISSKNPAAVYLEASQSIHALLAEIDEETPEDVEANIPEALHIAENIFSELARDPNAVVDGALPHLKEAMTILTDSLRNQSGALVRPRLAIADTATELTRTLPKVVADATGTLDTKLNKEPSQKLLYAKDDLEDLVANLDDPDSQQDSLKLINQAVASLGAFLDQNEDDAEGALDNYETSALERVLTFLEQLPQDDRDENEMAADIAALRKAVVTLSAVIDRESGALVKPRIAIAKTAKDLANTVPRIVAKSTQFITDAGQDLLTHADDLITRQRLALDHQLTAKPDAILSQARADLIALNRAVEQDRSKTTIRRLIGKSHKSLRSFYRRAEGILGRPLNEDEDRYFTGIIRVLSRNSVSTLESRDGRKLTMGALSVIDKFFHQKAGTAVRLTAHFNEGVSEMAGTVDGLLTKQRKALVREVDVLERRLTQEPPVVLKLCRNALQILIKALQTNAKPEDINALYRNATYSLSALMEQNDALNRPFINNEESEFLCGALRAQASLDLPVLEKALGMLDKHYRQESGTISKLNQAAVDTTDQVAAIVDRTLSKQFDRLENLPIQIASNVAEMLGLPAPVAKTPAEKADSKRNASSDPEAPRTTGLGSFLGGAREYFQSFISGAKSTVKKEAAAFFASSLASGLEFIKPQLKGNEKGLAIIERLIATLKQAPEQNNWEEVLELLKQCPKTLGGLQISLLGKKMHTFKAPASIASSESVERSSFKENILRTKDALNIKPATEEVVNLEAMIEGQRDLLVTNLSEYTPMRAVYENILGVTPVDGDSFYFELQKKAHENATAKSSPSSELRKLFFQEIDKTSLSTPRKWIAKLAYFIISPIASFGLGKFTNEFIDHAREQIAQYDNNGFKKFSTNSIDNFNRYLSTLIGAHNRAAKNEEIDDTLLHMVEGELNKPYVNKVNGKPHSPKELYANVAGECVDQFVPKLGWCKKIADFFESVQISSTSSFHFLNPVVKVAMFIVSSLIRVIVFLPEFGLNKLFNVVLKKFIIKHEIVDGILDKSVNAIRDANGYSNAINKIIIVQLEKIWELLNTNEGDSVDQEVSLAHKQELTSAVKNLFKVLKMNAKATHAESLSQLSLLEKGIEEIDNMFIQDVVETATTLIGVALKSVMQKDQFEKQLYNFMTLMNESFKTGVETTEVEFQRNEKRIMELIDSILTHAIRTAVRKKFDFSGDQGLEATEKCLGDIREKTSAFITTADQALKSDEPLTKDTFAAQVMAPFLAFQEEMDQLAARITGDKEIDSGAREALDAYCHDLANKSAALEQLFEEIQSGLAAGRDCQALIQRAGQRMEEIQKWSQDLQTPPHINILPPSAGGFIETLEDLTFNRVRHYVDELVKMVRQPHNYRHLFHHMALIPFLESAAAKNKQ